MLRLFRASSRLFPSLMGGIGWVLILVLASCEREPLLHLYDAQSAEMDLPVVDLDLEVYWNYEMEFDIDYDWQAEWYYGWDETDSLLWGVLGYTDPTVFNLRRYYTGEIPLAKHTGVIRTQIEGTHFQGMYDWGYWDILCWNEIQTPDNIQSIIIDEESSLDSVMAYTNQTMHTSRFQAPRYTHAFYAPEPLFSAYDQGIEINRNLDGFTYDAERNVYVKKLNMTLMPLTYIYLTQVILHNNNGRITAVDGNADLSGMARSTNLNTGRSGSDAITVYYNVRMKHDCPMVPYRVKEAPGYDTPSGPNSISESPDGSSAPKTPEIVDIIGGRLMTFGLCHTAANRISRAEDVDDPHRHYIDMTMQFNNGMDSTFVFDVTDQVRRRYKGGVITIELDVDTIPIPTRRGGSGFNAVVQDTEDGGTYEFDM